MYNLKAVTVGISACPDEIKLVVSDNAGPQSFNLLYRTSVPNKQLYDASKVLRPDRLKAALAGLVGAAQKYTELKVDKVVLAFEELVHDYRVSQIKTDFFTYKSPQKVHERISKAIDAWNQANQNGRVLCWEAVGWFDAHSRRRLAETEIAIGSKYMAKIDVYTSDHALVAGFADAVRGLNLKIAQIRPCVLNANQFASPGKRSAVLAIHDRISHLSVYAGGAPVARAALSFGQAGLREFVLNSLDKSMVAPEYGLRLLSGKIDTLIENNVNLVFRPGDAFDAGNYVKPAIVSALVAQYCAKAVAEVAAVVDLGELAQLHLVSDQQSLAKFLVAHVKKADRPPAAINLIKNDLMLVESKFYPLALSVRQYAKALERYRLADSCVQPYYSQEYDRRLEIKLTTMRINNNITKTIQKIIK